ncbi:putative ATP-dependent RNA helicase SoYb [Drosophila subobscura]|uniref:putative ATP-dependent RNA helicase SoYb n=1 Tax=Drosophila subobscura TaxID=7241 RepID=UPI00155B24B6|nr:putative ATP-dependent RNA helicase SoYb [Drosophila subobscura]XP_034668892.1 putative ATP-dependent RNA helicase SoYb [Drosophila subobscura]XP_034668893.1 putative ATP-dependent RNA helicase SoYb [Drosophila subobscura]
MHSGNDPKRDLAKPEDCQGKRILITHYISPQQFWYISAKNVEACSALVRQMELQLVEHCQPQNQQASYSEYLEVIVRYMLCSPPKLMRGVIKKRQSEEYLVFAMDYGFTINCSAKHLWILPGNLNKKLYDVEMGGVAFITPYKGNTWTKAALSVFGQKLEEAHMLYLDIRYQGPMNENFGILWIKSNGQAVNAVDYLEERLHGRRENSCNMPHYLDPLSFELAEINDEELKAGLRATKMIQLVAASNPPLAIEQHRIPSNTELCVDRNPFRRNHSPPCPTKDPKKLERILQLRSEPPIPDAARRLSKVSGSGDNSVQTALIGGSNKKENVEEKVEKRNQVEGQSRELKLTSRASMSEGGSPSRYSGLLAGQEDIDTNKQRSETSEPKACSSAAVSLLPKEPATVGQVVVGAEQKPWQKINILLAKRCFTHSSALVSASFAHNMSDAFLGKEIENALQKLSLRNPVSTQSFAWPHLMKGNSLLLVNAPGTGRSWCYLPALCSLVMRSMAADGDIIKKKGPLAVLLTECSKQAKLLSKHCSVLMQNFETQTLKVVNTHDHAEPEVVTMLLGSCGILVSTIGNLNALMDYKRKGLALFEPARLKHIVVDDFDRMQQAAPQLLNDSLNRLRRLRPPQMQLIIVAQCWHEQAFPQLLKWTSSNMLIFGDFLEAAMYGRVKLTMAVGQSQQKCAQLLQFLACQPKPQKRTIIFCNTPEELKHLRIVLTNAGHQCVLMWKAQEHEPHQLLLVYDAKQLLLMGRNKELLIHFSVPKSWENFALRFHVMEYLVQNRLNESLKQLPPPTITSHVMLDECNSKFESSLKKFLKVHGLSTEKLSEEMSRLLPQVGDSLPLCLYHVKTGECTRRQCNMRHHFLKSDIQTSRNPCQQSKAVVRCKPCKIYDPAHMALWPMEYMMEGTTVWLDAPYPVSRWIAEVELSVPSNPKQHQSIRISDICLVHQQGLYKRVRVMDIHSEEAVMVQLMDHGTELIQIRPWDLLECDAKFRGLPMLAMDVKLPDVEPTTGEAKWSPESLKWVQDTFSRLQDGEYIQITVNFSMLDVAYVKEIILIEKCPTLRTSVFKSVLRKELIARGFGKLATKSLDQWPVDSLTCRGLATSREEDKPQMQKQVLKAERKDNDTMEAVEKADCRRTPEPNVDRKDDQIKEKYKMAASCLTVEEQKQALANADCQLSSPTLEPTLDGSQRSFLELLNGQLANENLSSNAETRRFLQTIVGGDEGDSMRTPAETSETIIKSKSNPVHCLTDAGTPGTSTAPEPSKDEAVKALQCATTRDGTVAWPMVKWHQTLSQIELVIEQKVPEYELFVQRNFLSYFVGQTSPPQRCSMNLLGEVVIASEKLHGYSLHIKLSKVGPLFYWPTLLNSLYTQQHSHWLSYDIERAKEPPSHMGLLLWERYMRQVQTKVDSTTESVEYDSVDSDLSDSALYDDAM